MNESNTNSGDIQHNDDTQTREDDEDGKEQKQADITTATSSKRITITAAECCATLSAALENGVTIATAATAARTETSNGTSDDDDDPVVEKATNAFVTIMSSSASERLSYLEAIRSMKFQKRHARRLFVALIPILKHIFDDELYVPLSAFENEDDDETKDDDNCIMDNNDENQEQNQSDIDQDDDIKVNSTGDTRTSSTTTTRNKRNSDISQLSDCNSIVPDHASTQALLFIKYSALLVNAFVDNQMNRSSRKKRTKGTSIDGTEGVGAGTGAGTGAGNIDIVFDMIEEVYAVAELLHNNLFSLNSCGREGMVVQKGIITICESYWKGRFTDREVLVTQLMPLLVVKSLNGNATKADLKRLWNMRDALQLLDFQEQSTIVQLRNLLLKTVSSPLFMKHIEGRKMVAFLFRLDVSLVKDLHQSIRAQIPFAKMTILEAYGGIYFDAWKDAIEDTPDDKDDEENENGSDASTSIQNSVEDALQDLMFASLHAPSPHMAKAILTVLEPLHSQKRNPDVDSLLYRMYSPILWRALSATNPLVRIHASISLRTTFPLHDPNAGKAHLKESNAKSIEVLICLLNDNDPKVRVAGCDAAIRILGVFWDALRSEHIRSLLNEIIMKHANDSSSAAVRAQAVKGITLLLDAPASHGVLRPLLPLIGNHIHDSVERVRLACVRLLLKLKSIKGI